MKWSASETPRPLVSRLPVMFVHSDAQWEALCSASRVEILQTLQARGPLSVPELGHLMDAAPDGLYHHARILERAGLIRLVSVRTVGKRRERVLDASSERLRLDVDVELGRNTSRLERLLSVFNVRAQKHLASAFAARLGRTEGPAPDVVVHADAAWLDDEALARITDMLDEIRRVFEHGRSRRQGRLCSLSFAMSPIARARESSARPTKRVAKLIEELSHAPKKKALRKVRARG